MPPARVVSYSTNENTFGRYIFIRDSLFLTYPRFLLGNNLRITSDLNTVNARKFTLQAHSNYII